MRLAYKQEEQSRLEIFENLVTQAFPLSNGLVSTTLRRGLPQIGGGVGIDDLLGSVSALIFYDLFVFSFLEVWGEKSKYIKLLILDIMVHSDYSGLTSLFQ